MTFAPQTYRVANNSRLADPEVWFRTVYLTSSEAGSAGLYRNQKVEIALGPTGAFENSNIGILTRRVQTDRAVGAVPKGRGRPKLQNPETPRVVELLRKALEWQALLDCGDIPNRAATARRQGITGARVTQVMRLLRLAPEIQHHVLSMPDVVPHARITVRALRPIVLLSQAQQHAAFRALLQKRGS